MTLGVRDEGRQALLPDVDPIPPLPATRKQLRAIDFGTLFPVAKAEAKRQGITFTAFVKRAVAKALGNPVVPEPDEAPLSRDEKVQFEVDEVTFEFVRRAAAAEQLSVNAWGGTLLHRLGRSHRGLFPSETESLERARSEFADARRELARALKDGGDAERQAALQPVVKRMDGYYNQVAAILRLIDLDRLERLHGKNHPRRR